MRIKLVNHFRGAAIGLVGGTSCFSAVENVAANFLVPSTPSFALSLLLGGALGWVAYRTSSVGFETIGNDRKLKKTGTPTPLLKNIK